MDLVLDTAQDATRPAESGYDRADRFPLRSIVAAIAVSVALRARFITTPLTSDEGGYMAIARAWASGKHLYTDAWVDRPQGLLLLFRSWDWLTGGSAPAIRIMAILFGCVAVVSVAYIVFTVAGRRAATVSALLVAVASANARIEGFIANGELLAGTIAAAGVAAACAYMFRGRGESWLLVGGVLAGCAMSLKQSGFDGFLAVMVCLIAGGLTGERNWRQVLRECAISVAGLAAVLAALLVHGIILGFSSWWYAVAGYRIGGLNVSDGDWHRFRITAWIAAPTIVPLLIASIVGLVVWLVRDRRITRATVLVPAWIGFASLAFVTGGLFHRHYWVTLTFPLAAAAAIAVARQWRWRTKVRWLVAVTCVLIVPSLISTAQVIKLERGAAASKASDDSRLVTDELVGRWYTEHRTSDSTFYVLCNHSGAYAAAHADPPYPYLWLDGVQHGKNAQTKLEQLFAGDHPPTFVAVYQMFSVCNPSGRVQVLLHQRYTRTVDLLGVIIYTLRETALPAQSFGRRTSSTVT